MLNKPKYPQLVDTQTVDKLVSAVLFLYIEKKAKMW